MIETLFLYLIINVFLNEIIYSTNINNLAKDIYVEFYILNN